MSKSGYTFRHYDLPLCTLSARNRLLHRSNQIPTTITVAGSNPNRAFDYLLLSKDTSEFFVNGWTCTIWRDGRMEDFDEVPTRMENGQVLSFIEWVGNTYFDSLFEVRYGSTCKDMFGN